MTLTGLVKLVKSLSGSEKRYFRLYSSKQSGDKGYLVLFDIVVKSDTDMQEIRNNYKKSSPSASLHNTTNYLAKLIVDSLVQPRTERDNFFQLLQDIMRMRILKERALLEESQQHLQKIRKASVKSQQHLIEYFTYREQLTQLADENFNYISDHKLIEDQMKGKEILRKLNHIHDHHSLFELLKYRLIYSGKISSDDEKKRLDDLMLSEMTLITGKSKNSFASQKLHLLFQSFFFTDLGDHQSALKVFHSLNKLFEQNLELLDNPPLDYLSTLAGIPDSLLSLKKYDEINYYLDKIRLLDQLRYPEYFRYQVKKTLCIYQLALYTSLKKYTTAIEYIESLDESVLKLYQVVSEEKQWELYFYCALAYAGDRHWNKAQKYLGILIQQHKAQPQWLICKAARLLDIILYYELGEVNFLEYEIRSYKRFFGKMHPLTLSEKLLLKTLLLIPDAKKKKLPMANYRKLEKQVRALEKDKYERQLLKYFDFGNWVLERFA